MDHWLITALGMGTVFLALIALSLIIGLFPAIFSKPERKRPNPAPLPELNEPTVQVLRAPAAEAPSVPAGPALVALIAAAVSAASGAAPGSFRVASVEAPPGPGGFNTPVWGHVDRLVRASQNR